MSLITLTVDNRERELIRRLDSLSVAFEKTNLTVGDITITKDDKILIVIERKTLADLASSIKDGRYREQRHRLIKEYGIERVMYIVEGNWHGIPSYVSGMSKEIIKSAIINTLIRDGIRIVMLRDVAETADFISCTMKRMMKNPDNYGSSDGGGSDYCEVACHAAPTKKSYITPDVFTIMALCQVPGVSKTIAKTIVAEYPTISDLVYKADAHRISELKLESGRRIGSKLAEQILRYFNG